MAETSEKGVIRAQALAKHYDAKVAVQDVSLTLQAGEIVGLLGPNGAGKTTTFYMVVGLIPASHGRVFLDGRNVSGLPMWQRARQGVGYLPQEASIFRKLTVWENVMAVVETLGLDAATSRDRVAQQLTDLGLEKLARQPAFTLSGGERRRLEIARALATHPRFLLMDEPFSGVDPISVAEVQAIIRKLKARGIGILITDHNVRETLAIVDRAYLIHQGRVLVSGTPSEIINNPESRRHYLGESFKL
ncbi:MAG: LPS export ABC transporter ATP-binding protein [Opitutia bacterium]|nr:LPS export ABC transporter ATP-binding protein [Opitutales bacterium]PHX79604.1 MAG: LPS export ABC transporter ATP-binding protein [Opitutae bacterium]